MAIYNSNTGNARIGTTGPGQKLEVYGTSPIAYLQDRGSGSPKFTVSNSNDAWSVGFAGNNSGYAIRSGATGATRLTIKSVTGNACIGY